MILDVFMSPKNAERYPYYMLLMGAAYTALGIMGAYFMQKSQSSMIMVFLTALAAMPLMYRIITYEECKDEQCLEEKTLLKEHCKALEAFMFLFLGMTIAFSLARTFLPAHMSDIIFSQQAGTIAQINGYYGEWTQGFLVIFTHNMGVVFFCTITSLFYGLGAIYILTWNASVLGTAMGDYISTGISHLADKVGFEKVAGYFHTYSCGYFIKYLPHGIPEILAYFAAGLGAGIISIAIVRHTFGTKKFANIIFDSSDMLLIAIVLTAIAALIEVSLTPTIVSTVC